MSLNINRFANSKFKTTTDHTMLHYNMFKNCIVLFLAVLIGLTTACTKKNEDPKPTAPVIVGPPVVTKGFRKPMDYNTLTPTTSYRGTFLDEAGDSTVDRNEGRNRLRMFRALASYISTSITNGTVIDATKLNNMFENKNAPFDAPYTDLNALLINMKEVTGSSKANQAQVHAVITDAFAQMARISTEGSKTAAKGVAGKSGTYLLDEAGVEWAQIIQKSLIGAYQLDYISNILLNTGLNADNTGLVSGKKYTALEHNWDLAYGFLSLNDIYGSKEVKADETVTPAIRASSGELYLGSYAWEYNKTGYVKLHTAFLKGRAAIVNNDMEEVKVQAAIIRNVLETPIGASAYGYMNKSTNAPHAFAEGLGFIYSTRFCSLNGADDAFSLDLSDDLFDTPQTTFYDITAMQYTTVKNKLVSKFNLQ